MSDGLYERLAPVDLYALQCDKGLYEKQAAFWPAVRHAVGMAAGGHFTTNLLGLAAHHGSNVGDMLAHRGLQHGLNGQSLTLAARQSIKSIFGPESLITYEAGAQAAKKLLEVSPHPTDRLHNMFGVLQQQVAHDTPVLGSVQRAIAHHVSGTEPTLQASGLAASVYSKMLDRMTNSPLHGAETGAQKVVKNLRDMIPAAAFVGADAALSQGIPFGAAGHFAWNGARQAAGHVDIGRKMIAEEVVKGLENKMPGRAQTLGFDLGASPAFLDARRMGQRVSNHAQDARGMGDVLRVTPGNRAEILRAVEHHMDKALGEPKVRLLPHIKVEPTGRPTPSYTPQARPEF